MLQVARNRVAVYRRVFFISITMVFASPEYEMAFCTAPLRATCFNASQASFSTRGYLMALSNTRVVFCDILRQEDVFQAYTSLWPERPIDVDAVGGNAAENGAG